MDREIGEFVDRSGWIRFFGVLEILGGLLILCFMLLGLVGIFASREIFSGKLYVMSFINVFLAYGAIVGIFICCGIGSLMIKRWVRGIMVIFSCFWLIIGIMTVLLIALSGKSLFLNAGAPNAAFIIMMTVLSIVFIIIPGTFLFFYLRPNVKKTFEHYGPHPTWIDKCPLPVLGFSFFYAFGVVGSIGSVFMEAVPFFGIMLKGHIAILLMLSFAIIYAFVVYGLYRLKMTAWFTVLIINIIWMVSGIVTSLTVSMEDFYRQMGMSDIQLKTIGEYNYLWDNSWIYVIVWFLLLIGYQIYLLRFFKKEEISGV